MIKKTNQNYKNIENQCWASLVAFLSDFGHGAKCSFFDIVRFFHFSIKEPSFKIRLFYFLSVNFIIYLFFNAYLAL